MIETKIIRRNWAQKKIVCGQKRFFRHVHLYKSTNRKLVVARKTEKYIDTVRFYLSYVLLQSTNFNSNPLFTSIYVNNLFVKRIQPNIHHMA